MNRRRDRRESHALRYLVERGCASALDLGTAAVRGEPKPMRLEGRDILGLKLGAHFVNRGFARVTRNNLFEWVPPAR